MVNFSHKDIRGIVVPLITPINDTGSVDIEAVSNLINHVIGKCERPYVDGLFVNGYTGEFHCIPKETKKDMLKASVDACSRRLSIVFGVTGCSLDETLEMAYYAQDNGADGIVVAPFFFHNSDRGLPQIIREIASEISLPIYLYNNPAFATMGPRKSERNIKTAIFKRIILENGNVWGIKDSSGDLGRFENYQKVATYKPGVRVFMGDERMMTESVDIVPSFANLDPETCRKLYNECLDFENGRKEAIQNYINEAGKIVYCDGRKRTEGLKFALSCLGICTPNVIKPSSLTPKEKEKIEEFVRKDCARYNA